MHWYYTFHVNAGEKKVKLPFLWYSYKEFSEIKTNPTSLNNPFINSTVNYFFKPLFCYYL